MNEFKLDRMHWAILLTLYKHDPIPLTECNIDEAIRKDGLLEMSDEEFSRYGATLCAEKEMIKNLRLN